MRPILANRTLSRNSGALPRPAEESGSSLEPPGLHALVVASCALRTCSVLVRAALAIWSEQNRAPIASCLPQRARAALWPHSRFLADEKTANARGKPHGVRGRSRACDRRVLLSAARPGSVAASAPMRSRVDDAVMAGCEQAAVGRTRHRRCRHRSPEKDPSVPWRDDPRERAAEDRRRWRSPNSSARDSNALSPRAESRPSSGQGVGDACRRARGASALPTSPSAGLRPIWRRPSRPSPNRASIPGGSEP